MLSHYVVFFNIYIYIYFLLDILVCSIIEYFNQSVEQVKMQTMSKTTWQY